MKGIVMKRILAAAVFGLVAVSAIAQEIKRSEIELFFLRPDDFVDRQMTFQGRMVSANRDSGYFAVPADRLGEKSFVLHWKDKSGPAWEEIQLQCGPKHEPQCKKMSITGKWAKAPNQRDFYYLEDVEYKFVK